MAREEASVRGYAELERALRQKRPPGRPLFVYFSGDKDPATGASWCPDCVKAEPVVRAELPNLPEGAAFLYCQVGDRAYWKDPDNEFRKNLKLTGVPTLLKYGTHQSGTGPTSATPPSQQLCQVELQLPVLKVEAGCADSWRLCGSQLMQTRFLGPKEKGCSPRGALLAHPQKLTEEECFNPELVRMLFTED